MSERFVLRARFGPPDKKVYQLYSETPVQKDWIVKVKKIESAQRLMVHGYDLLEDPTGKIDPSKKPLSADDAAEVLNVSRSAIYKWIKNGKLPAKEVDGQYKISHADVVKLKKE